MRLKHLLMLRLRLILVSTIAIAVLLGPNWVFSDEIALQALNQGLEYYNELEFEKAISSLENALKRELDRFDKIKAYQYLALCYDALDQTPKVTEAFSQILDIDLNFQAPSDFPPRLSDIITQLRIKKTIIEVTSTPSGAKIIVDGKEISKTTPAKFTADELGVGTHSISASLVDYSAEAQPISIYPGKPQKVEIKLLKVPKEPVDTEKPKISLLTTVKSANLDKDIQVKARVTDNIKMASVKLFYKLPQTDFLSANMEVVAGVAGVAGNEYQFTIRKELLKKGKLEFYIEAKDGADNAFEMPHQFIELKEAGGGKTWLWVALGTVAAGGAGAAAMLSSSKGAEPKKTPPLPEVQTGSISLEIKF